MSILVSLAPARRSSAAELLARSDTAKEISEFASGVPREIAKDSLLVNSRTESVGTLWQSALSSLEISPPNSIRLSIIFNSPAKVDEDILETRRIDLKSDSPASNVAEIISTNSINSVSRVITELFDKLRSRLFFIFVAFSGAPGASPTNRPYNPRLVLNKSTKREMANNVHVKANPSEIAII